MFVVVPNALRDAINAKLDKAILDCPGAAPHREELYAQLLSYFNENGVVPDFTLKPKGVDPR